MRHCIEEEPLIPLAAMPVCTGRSCRQLSSTYVGWPIQALTTATCGHDMEELVSKFNSREWLTLRSDTKLTKLDHAAIKDFLQTLESGYAIFESRLIRHVLRQPSKQKACQVFACLEVYRQLLLDCVDTQ